MVPILNRPLIDILVNNAIDAGIEEVIIILSERKKNLIQYFEKQESLEQNLIEKTNNYKNTNKKLLQLVQRTNQSSKIRVVFQDEQLGLAHAISLAADYVKNEPFAVVLGDDLIVSRNKPVLTQIFERYQKFQSSIFCVRAVEKEDISKYGIIDIKKNLTKNLYQINGFVEKPKPKNAPSNLAILGHYVFTPKFMEILASKKYSRQTETNLQPAIDELLRSERVLALAPSQTEWYDLGSVEGFVKATIDCALSDKAIKTSIKKHLLTKKIFKTKP